jgi:hypothetical protein
MKIEKVNTNKKEKKVFGNYLKFFLQKKLIKKNNQ